MAEEKELIKDKFIQFIYDVPDLKDKKNEKKMSPGFLTLSTQKITIIPEINNKPNDAEAKIITIQEIVDIDRKIDLWRKVLGSTTIVPIHFLNDGKENVTLISTTHDTAKQIKKILTVLGTNGSKVDYVCPFSKGGKIFLDQKPITGSIFLKKNSLVLNAEWLGKKQEEIIDLSKIDDFEFGKEGGDRPTSFIIKYQKDGVLTSTLVNADERTIALASKYIQMISHVHNDEGDSIELNEKQYMLLQMMYTSDIDAEMATGMLEIEMEELQKIVDDLISLEILKISGSDEYELTEKGTKKIVEQMKKNIG